MTITITPVPAVPAYQSEALSALFARNPISATTLPNMATMANPADGFGPTRLASGTEVLWISSPSQLGIPDMAPLWQNGLGLVVYRNEARHCMGAIFVHGAMKTTWSTYGPEAWHSLGGIMAFSGFAFEQAIEMVLGKGYAMTPKWRHIDKSLKAVGHPNLTHLGGGKAILIHGPGDEEKRGGVAVSAEVVDAIGIYISGPDQNMDPSWCGEFAKRAPRNFVGSGEAQERYRGIKPSKHTARGVFRGLKVVCEELIGDSPPIFFEGYGGVGKVMAALAVENGFPISGLVDVVVDPLLGLRKALPSVPLFLNAKATEENFGPQRREEEMRKAGEAGIHVVESLTEALRLAPSTRILSPNAGPHPITMEAADYLITSAIRAVVGSTNNMLGLVKGSPNTVAWRLMQNGIFAPNDSRINRIGAMACVIDVIGLDRSVGLARQILQVGEDVREEIKAYRKGVPPQIYSDALAAEEWNLALDEGLAMGGRFPSSGMSGYV